MTSNHTSANTSSFRFSNIKATG